MWIFPQLLREFLQFFGTVENTITLCITCSRDLHQYLAQKSSSVFEMRLFIMWIRNQYLTGIEIEVGYLTGIEIEIVCLTGFEIEVGGRY